MFRPRLKTAVDRKVLSSVGKRFQARGAVTENALSPSLRRVLGPTKLPFDASRSADRDGRRKVSDSSEQVVQVSRCVADYLFVG